MSPTPDPDATQAAAKTASTASNSRSAGSTVPPSPLTVARRRELQQRFERAWSGYRDGSASVADVHAWIAPCVGEDPACALYVDALLLNLRRSDGSKKAHWLVRGWRQTKLAAAALRKQWEEVLATGPDVLRCAPTHPPTLWALVDAAHASGYRESAWRYAEEALRVAPESPESWRRCARTLAARGQFALAADFWRRVAAVIPGDPESLRVLPALPALAALPAATPRPAARSGSPRTATKIEDAKPIDQNFGMALESSTVDDFLQRLDTLRRLADWEEAEGLMRWAANRWGRDLRLEEAGEELALARHADQAAQAERLAAVDSDPAWPLLAAESRASLARLETEIWAARALRQSRDPEPQAELARRLTARRDWSQAVIAWEETLQRCDNRTASELVGESWLRLAECRQRLRRFESARDAYRKVMELAADPQNAQSDSWSSRRQAASEQLKRLA